MGVGALGKSLVQTAARFEDVRSIFAQMTGSTAAATTEFEKLLELGRNSSVETLKLAELQASLLATQIKLTTDEWLTLIEAAENTLVPAQTLENLAIFRQRLDQGVVSLRDLDRVADRGLPVYRILQDELGLTRRELDKLNGSADVVEKTFGALTTGLEKMFSGSAERRANNLSRLMNNFGDAVQAGADVFARGFAPQLKAAIDGITKFIDEHPAQIAALGQFTGDTLQAMLTAVQIIAANAAVLKYVGLLLLVPAGIAAATGLWKVIGWTFTKIAGAYNALKEGGKFLARMTQAASTIGGIGTGLGLGYLAGNVLGMEDVDKRIDKSVRKLEHRVARSANRLGAVTGAAFAAAATSQIEGARAVLRASARVGWVGGVLMRYTPHFLAADVAITGVANAVDKVSEAQSDLNEYLATMDAEPLTWWDTFLLKVAKLREELGLVKSASEDLLTSLSERGDPTSVRNAGGGHTGRRGRRVGVLRRRGDGGHQPVALRGASARDRAAQPESLRGRPRPVPERDLLEQPDALQRGRGARRRPGQNGHPRQQRRQRAGARDQVRWVGSRAEPLQQLAGGTGKRRGQGRGGPRGGARTDGCLH